MNICYEIKHTPIYGNGIYATEPVHKGCLIWEYRLFKNVLEFNKEQSIAYLHALANLERQQHFLDITYGRGDVLCLILDDGKNINHADGEQSNCVTDLMTGNCYAKRDIAIGEQLFEDYTTYTHPPFLLDLLAKYDCAPTYYELPTIL